MIGGCWTVLVPQNVSAVGPGQSCGAPILLGFRPWYADLCNGNTRGSSEIELPQGEDETISFIWAVALNILFDLFLAVGYLALGFVVYGGFLYIMAQGDPGKAAKGQRTLTTAVIGTVIAMSATVVVNTAKIVLGITSNEWKQHATYTGQQMLEVFNWVYTVAGLVAVVFIVKGGIEYVISRGDPSKIQKATRAVIYAIVGLVIVLLAAAITTFIISSTQGAMGATA